MQFVQVPTATFFQFLEDEPDFLRRIVALLFTPDGNGAIVATGSMGGPLVLRDDFVGITSLRRVNSHGAVISGTQDIPSAILAQLYEFLYGKPRGFLGFENGFEFRSVQEGKTPNTAYYLPKGGHDAPQILSEDSGVTRLLSPIVGAENLLFRGFSSDGEAMMCSYDEVDEVASDWEVYQGLPFGHDITVRGYEADGRGVVYATAEGLRTSMREGAFIPSTEGQSFLHIFRAAEGVVHGIRELDEEGSGEVVALTTEGPQVVQSIEAAAMVYLRRASSILVEHPTSRSMRSMSSAFGVVEYELNRYHLERFAFRD